MVAQDVGVVQDAVKPQEQQDVHCVVQQIQGTQYKEFTIAKVAQVVMDLLVVLEEQQEQLAVIYVVLTFRAILLQESMTARVAQDALGVTVAPLLLLVWDVSAA